MTDLGVLFPGASTTNPNTNAVLVTTGDLVSGNYSIQAILSTTANAAFNIEILDAANAIVQTLIVRCAANTSFSACLNSALTLGSNYEIRIRPFANITGTVACSLVISLVSRA